MGTVSDPDTLHQRLADYAASLFATEDELLAEVRREMERRDFPMIQVPASTGKLLQVLVAAVGGRRVLEIGTLAGYSAIWMARALPADGRLLTLEKEEEHATVARRFLERAGLSDVVEVRVGEATELLGEIGPDGGWDVVFVDADKESYPLYAEHAARLLRPGGLLLADNALWHGKVVEPDPDETTRSVLGFNEAMAASEAFTATVVPVGDGVMVAARR